VVNVARRERTTEREPADRTRDVAVTAQHPAACQNARTDAGANGEEDRVASAASCAPPGLTEDIRGAVAVDRYAFCWTERGAQLVKKRIVIPSRNVWSPHFFGF